MCVVNTITMTSTAWCHCLEGAQPTVVSLPAALTPMWRPTQGKMIMECLCVVIKIVLRPSVPGKSQEASRNCASPFKNPCAKGTRLDHNGVPAGRGTESPETESGLSW